MQQHDAILTGDDTICNSGSLWWGKSSTIWVDFFYLLSTREQMAVFSPSLLHNSG